MFQDSYFLERFLNLSRKIIPRPVFEFFQPWYHGVLALSGAVIFGFPSRRVKVIGVTGSKGKSTTVYLLTKFLEEAEFKVAAIGSLGYKIGDREWPNDLKMTMPGRWKVQKFLSQAVKAGCRFVVLEITSEGIKQKRHLGVKFDAAVFTNLEKEHIEAHGSFEKYYQEKQKLFRAAKNIHILNADSPYVDLFSRFPARKKVFYSLKVGQPREHSVRSFSGIPAMPSEVVGRFASLPLGPSQNGLRIRLPNIPAAEINVHSYLIGDFNFHNVLAAIAMSRNYGVSDETIQKALDKIKSIPGRMEFVEAGQPFKVVVDYAHTPGSLEAVYKTLKSLKFKNSKMICILGAAGGGRDKWKRPVFGELAEKYCDEIILTNEDPYDENPEKILDDVEKRIKNVSKFKVSRIMDRREAIKKTLTSAGKGDIVVITGKGSETSIAVAKGKKIPWSDKGVIIEELNSLRAITDN